MEQRVLEHRRVAVREHEAVAQHPARVLRIEAKVIVPELEGGGRERHRRTHVANPCPLDRVDGEEADRVLDSLEKIGAGLDGHSARILARWKGDSGPEASLELLPARVRIPSEQTHQFLLLALAGALESAAA